MDALSSGIVPIANLPGTGSLIARSYAIYKSQFQKISQLFGMLILGFLINVSLSSFAAFLGQTAPAFGKVFLKILSLGISVGVGIFYCYVFSAIIHVIAAWYRQGEHISLREACVRASKVYKPLFLVGLLYGFVIAGTSFFIILPALFSQGAFPVDIPSFRGLLILYLTAFQWGAMVAVVLPLLFSVWYYFSIYAVILDGDRGIEALAKSRYLMHGMFFKVTGRYITALVLLFLLFFVIYLTLAFPFGWIIFSVLSVAFAFFALPFFAVYEYLRYEDLYTIERTTEFVFIKGERKSILSWAVIGGIVMALNILGGFYALLPEVTRENIQASFVRGSLRILAPASIEMNKNTQVLINFFSKFRAQQPQNTEATNSLLPDEGGSYAAPKNYSDYNPPLENQGTY